jgi:hypothetical protein
MCCPNVDVVVKYTEPNLADTSSSSSDGSGQDAIELRKLCKWPACASIGYQVPSAKAPPFEIMIEGRPHIHLLANGTQKEHHKGSHSTPLGRRD